jgi:hypothetical protein
MDDKILQFDFLWDGSAPEWALCNVSKDAHESPKYVIVNTETRMVKLIENNILFSEVINKMLSSGVRIVSVGNGF